MPRTRTKVRIFAGWTRGVWNGAPYKAKTSSQVTRVVTDTVHPPPYTAEDDLIINTVVGRPATVNYRVRESATKDVDGWNVPVHWPQASFGRWVYPWDVWKTEALLSIQDSSPAFNLPQAIAELKDFPGLLKSAFKLEQKLAGKLTVKQVLHPSTAAEAHLVYQFGLKPLVSDVLKLLSVQEQLAAQVASHNRKQRTKRAGGRLHTKAFWNKEGTLLHTGNRSLPFWPNYPYQTSWGTKHTAWWSARLEPTGELPAVLEELQSNPTGRGKLTLATLWELTPWSFLADYFANLGDYIEYQGNKKPYLVKSLSLMCTTSIDLVCRPTGSSSGTRTVISNQPGEWSVIEKRRKMYYNPTASLGFRPLVSGQQALNILALAAAKY